MMQPPQLTMAAVICSAAGHLHTSTQRLSLRGLGAKRGRGSAAGPENAGKKNQRSPE